MISSNTSSMYLLQHYQENICDQNIRSIQEAMCSDEPSRSKFRRVYIGLPNLAVPTKSAMPGDMQVTYVHASVGNKYLRETVTDFSLSGYLKAPTVVLIDAEYTFAGYSEKIHLPTTEILLRATIDNLEKPKKL